MTAEDMILIERLITLAATSKIVITDIDDGQEYLIVGIEPGASEGILTFEIQKKDEDEQG